MLDTFITWHFTVTSTCRAHIRDKLVKALIEFIKSYRNARYFKPCLKPRNKNFKVKNIYLFGKPNSCEPSIGYKVMIPMF